MAGNQYQWLGLGIVGSLVAFHVYGMTDAIALGAKPGVAFWMLLAMAAAYAEAQGLEDVFYGAQAQDEYGYWDCTATFLERVNAVLGLNRARPVAVRAPFVARTKAEILRTGLELGVDFAHTWTCYRGGETACGTCPTCVERLAAFRALGIADPVPYGTAGA